MSQQTAEPSPLKSAAARLFDLRIMIGSLFTFYGIVLIIAGIFATAAEIQKAAGININLWMGVGMLILGLLFLLWWRLNPLQRPVDAADDDESDTQGTAGTVPVKDTNVLDEEHN